MESIPYILMTLGLFGFLLFGVRWFKAKRKRRRELKESFPEWSDCTGPERSEKGFFSSLFDSDSGGDWGGDFGGGDGD